MSKDADIQAIVASHDKQLETLTTQVLSVNSTVAQLSAKVESVSNAVAQLAGDVKQFMHHQSRTLENRPSQILEIIRTSLHILSTGAFLIGAVVAAIVYVSSNANNAEVSVMRYRLEQLEKAQGWAAAVNKLASGPENPQPKAR